MQRYNVDVGDDVPRGPEARVDAIDEDVGDKWDETLEITGASLEGPVPSGPVWASIKRIRGTINEYTGQVAAVGWYAGFQPPTVAALGRRLLQHELTVESHSS